MRIVIVNQDAIMARLMQIVLTEAGHEVVWTRSAEEALPTVIDRGTDGVLLDIDLPDVSGYELCRELREKQFVGPVIFVSERRDTQDKLRAFDHGADDYIIEPFDPRELVARIDVIARRRTQEDRQSQGTMLKTGDAELLTDKLAFQIKGRPRVFLTPTEMRLLEYLMRNVGTPIGRERLIERTWGDDYPDDSNRLEIYVTRLRNKIESNPIQPDYLLTIHEIGYVFHAPADSTEPIQRPTRPQSEGSGN